MLAAVQDDIDPCNGWRTICVNGYRSKLTRSMIDRSVILSILSRSSSPPPLCTNGYETTINEDARMELNVNVPDSAQWIENERNTALVLLLFYLEHGTVSRPLPLTVYSFLIGAFDFLECRQGLSELSVSDVHLYRPHANDVKINNSTTLKVLYRRGNHCPCSLDTGCRCVPNWRTELENYKGVVPIDSSPLSYPCLLGANRLEDWVIERLPWNFNDMANRICMCGTGCGRADFIKATFLSGGGNLWLAGGAVRRMFRQRRLRHCKEDLDFFFTGDTAGFDILIKYMYRHYAVHIAKIHPTMILYTENAVTLFALHGQGIGGCFPPVQLIRRHYPTVNAILSSFDIDASCYAFNGSKLVTNQRGFRSLKYNVIIVDPARQSPSYIYRLRKYYTRYHVDIVLPGFDMHRVDFAKIKDGTENHGLGALLRRSGRRSAGTGMSWYNSYANQIATSTTVEGLCSIVRKVMKTDSHRKRNWVIRCGLPGPLVPHGDETTVCDPKIFCELQNATFTELTGSFLPLDCDFFKPAYHSAVVEPSLEKKRSSKKLSANRCSHPEASDDVLRTVTAEHCKKLYLGPNLSIDSTSNVISTYNVANDTWIANEVIEGLSSEHELLLLTQGN